MATPRRQAIRRKLLTTTVLLLSAVGASVLVSAGSQHAFGARAADVQGADRAIVALQQLAIAMRDAYAHQAHTIILGNRTHLGHYAHALADAKQALTGARAALPADTSGDLEAITTALAALDENFTGSILPAVDRGDPEIAPAHDRALQLVVGAQQRIDAMAQRLEGAAQAAEQAARATARWTFLLHVAVLALALGLSVVVAWSVDRSISRPLLAVEAAASRLAAGDLSARIEPRADDEIGSLARRLNEMAVELDERQRKLIESEKLAGVGRLAAGVAHEINNPLGVILGYARLIERRTDPSLQKDARVILDEVARCQEIVTGLLDLARPTRLMPASADLAAVAREVVERVGAQAHVRITERGDARAVVDEGKVRQIVQNLVKNAVEAAPGGNVEVVVDGNGAGEVRLRVQDDGPGVDAKVRARLFEPFATTKEKGTGLGLAVSSAIAQAHGGRLELLPGAIGATFELVLPRQVEARG